MRSSANAKKAFKETIKANSKELQASLSNRRAEMDGTWDALDDDWKELEKQMAATGITELVSPDTDLLSLNVGGLHLNIRATVLQSLNLKQSNATLCALADLFKCVWDSRVPRDKDGRIFLDESPVILKYLVHSTIKASKTEGNVTVPDTTNTLAPDQHNYLHSFSAVVPSLRNRPLYPHNILIEGDSKLMTEDELKQLSVLLRESLPGDPQCLELIYQGSCDGLTANAFYRRCTGESPSTLTLVKVKHDGIGTGSSVVGGVSSTSWVKQGTNDCPAYYQDCSTEGSPGASIFMAIDGQSSGSRGVQLVKIQYPRSHKRPGFVKGGFRVAFRNFMGWAQFILQGSDNVTHTEVPKLKNLSSKMISELEVYRVKEMPVTSIPKDKYEMMNLEQVDNLRLFGALIAGSLMEERVALLGAQAELVQARERKEAAASALAAVYGPDIASGKSDPVVELSIRGTRMTTLRSTLQACPESALAARFDESKWPVEGKDFGVIDCSPSSFSKVLDVLRLKNRAKWSPSTQIKTLGCVEIPKVDRVFFEEFVGMYFPGCEDFIMDCVTFRKSSP